MNPKEPFQCDHLSCSGISPSKFQVPKLVSNPDKVVMVMISEVPPNEPDQYFYSPGDPDYLTTTLQAFSDANACVGSLEELVAQGIYLTTAIKCPKQNYKIAATTIKHCSRLLEKELALFPNVQVLMLMGDVAIKAFNYIAQRQTGKKVIPGGSTYKIRQEEYNHLGMRVFPSYLQTGKNYLMERSKREMIAEDINKALALIHSKGI